MPKILYKVNYDCCKSEAHFIIDTEVFTDVEAKSTLEFFDWDYDKEANPVDEVVKKYAKKAIEIATYNRLNLAGVKREFIEIEGYASVDGSWGIELEYIDRFEFIDKDFEVEKEVLI